MKMLVAVDLSETTGEIVSQVESITQASAARLWIVHVAQPKPELLEFDAGEQAERDFLAHRFRQEHCQIQSIADRLRDRGIEATALLVKGPTAETVLSEAQKLQVDMIVVGSRGRKVVSQLLLGSVSQEILHQSSYPVLVVPAHQPNATMEKM